MAGAVEGARTAKLLQCGIADRPAVHPRIARRLGLSSDKAAQSLDIQAVLRTAAGPEPLIINH
jgi:hypothetical protein